MHSELFRFGPVQIHGYGLMMALGFLSALAVWHRLSRGPDRVDSRLLSSLMLWMMIWGVAGARILHVLTHWPEFADAPWRIVRIDQGGLVFYGGFIGSLLGLILFIRRHHLPFLPMLDLVATGLPLGHAFGRIGCFLHGCCFGRVWDGPGAVCFPRESLPWWHHLYAEWIPKAAERSLPVIPTQLLAAGGNFLIFLALYAMARRRHVPGAIVLTYMLLYAPMRFLMESLRDDPRTAVGAFTISQILSLGLFCAGVAGWALLLTRRCSRTKADSGS